MSGMISNGSDSGDGDESDRHDMDRDENDDGLFDDDNDDETDVKPAATHLDILKRPKTSRLIRPVDGSIPLMDADSEEEFIAFFQHNLSHFPVDRYKAWLDFQSPAIRRAALICPPNKLYRLKQDDRLCAIAGYRNDGVNDVRIAVVILGDESQQFVDPTWLKDASRELVSDVKPT